MAGSNASILRHFALLAAFIVFTIFLIEKKFDALSVAVMMNSPKYTVAVVHPYYVVNENMSENSVEKLVDVIEQKFHFDEMAKARQPAVLNPGALGNLQTYLVPQITCPTAVRIGRVGDGGKWVCNPWRAPPGGACVVYAVGVNKEVSFERAIYEATKKRCRVFSFDPVAHSDAFFKPFNGTFRPWSIAGTTDMTKRRYSLPDIAANFSHSKIDFLKMDIESSEFETFRSLFRSPAFAQKHLEICQIFIEMHSDVGAWVNLHKSLQNNGFLMFYKEANYYCAPCHEYSFIHRNCTQRYGVYANPFNFNYA